MTVEQRPRAATPLCDLGVAASLRQRRRHGRAAYLIALFARRPVARPAEAVVTGHGRAVARAARTL